jgi:cytochrome c1
MSDGDEFPQDDNPTDTNAIKAQKAWADFISILRNYLCGVSFPTHRNREIANVSLLLKHLSPLALFCLAGCTDVKPDAPVGNYHAGVTAINTLGCGACHDIPGISWPKSNVGPPLHDYGSRSLIAGVARNTADNLAVFVRNATQFVPEGAMPPIDMTDQQAADIASYLLSLQDEG